MLHCSSNQHVLLFVWTYNIPTNAAAKLLYSFYINIETVPLRDTKTLWSKQEILYMQSRSFINDIHDCI